MAPTSNCPAIPVASRSCCSLPVGPSVRKIPPSSSRNAAVKTREDECGSDDYTLADALARGRPERMASSLGTLSGEVRHTADRFVEEPPARLTAAAPARVERVPVWADVPVPRHLRPALPREGARRDAARIIGHTPQR